jgi:hypothetical protein
VGKGNGNGPLGKYMCRRDNIKTNLKQPVLLGVDWIHPVSGRYKQQAAVSGFGGLVVSMLASRGFEPARGQGNGKVAAWYV